MAHVTEQDIRDKLNRASKIFGWPRHVVDQEKLEGLVEVWCEIFAGTDEFLSNNWNRAVDSAIKHNLTRFPYPADIVKEYRKMKSEGQFGGPVV